MGQLARSYSLQYGQPTMPKDVYEPEVRVPEGYVVYDFRPAKPHELFLSALGSIQPGPSNGLPRLILRKKPDPIAEVYGKPLSELKAPEGYEFTGEFRGPTAGEYGLSVYDYTVHRWKCGEPQLNRLILRKVQPKRYVFEETGEVRHARCSEWFLFEDDSIGKWDFATVSGGTYRILRRVE